MLFSTLISCSKLSDRKLTPLFTLLTSFLVIGNNIVNSGQHFRCSFDHEHTNNCSNGKNVFRFDFSSSSSVSDETGNEEGGEVDNGYGGPKCPSPPKQLCTPSTCDPTIRYQCVCPAKPRCVIPGYPCNILAQLKDEVFAAKNGCPSCSCYMQRVKCECEEDYEGENGCVCHVTNVTKPLASTTTAPVSYSTTASTKRSTSPVETTETTSATSKITSSSSASTQSSCPSSKQNYSDKTNFPIKE